MHVLPETYSRESCPFSSKPSSDDWKQGVDASKIHAINPGMSDLQTSAQQLGYTSMGVTKDKPDAHPPAIPLGSIHFMVDDLEAEFDGKGSRCM